MHGGKTLDNVCIELRNPDSGELMPIYINVFDHSLSRKWLQALNHLLRADLHLEKNYCFLGFVNHQRDGVYILDQVNRSITAINEAHIGYHIQDHFTMQNTMTDLPLDGRVAGRNIIQSRLNQKHS